MKPLKLVLSLILSLIIVSGIFAFPASAVTAQKVSLVEYTFANLSFKKPESDEYSCKITGNDDNNLKVSANNEGRYYWLMVHAKKATGKTVPTITIYKKEGSAKTTVKRFKITVTPVQQIEMTDKKLNAGTTVMLKLKNPYEKEYRFEFDSKLLKITQYLYSGDNAYYKLKGLKKGSTTIKAYLSGTKKLVGSFKVTVGDFKARIKQKNQQLTIYCNPHMASKYLRGGSANIAEMIAYYHPDGAISVSPADKSLITIKTVGADEMSPKGKIIFAQKEGETKLDVYEKRGDAAKVKIGTISLTVKRAKDSEVFYSNMEYDNDGLFYENFISPGEKYNLKKAVVSNYVNNKFTKSHFDSGEYVFKAKSDHPEIISFDKNGVATCRDYDKNGIHHVSYTVTFADGSKASGGGSFDIVEPDFY